MKLREISVHARYGFALQREFNEETHCVQEMYYMRIKGIMFGDFAKVNIILVETVELVKDSFLIANTANTYRLFDFDTYFHNGEKDRKLMILNEIHFAMTTLVSIESKTILQMAFDYCIEHDIRNHFRLNNQTYPSKNKDYFGAVDCYWEMKEFKAFGVIFDKVGVELRRQLLVEVPPYFGEFIYYAKCHWKGTEFVLRSKEGKEWRLGLD